jgi:hypothetical protein
MAEFELAAIAEDLVDTTPCPLFTPKHRSQSRNQAYSGLTPIPATSNVETSDFKKALFEQAKSEVSTENDSESAVESDAPAPPPKKLKSHSSCKFTVAATKAMMRRNKEVYQPEVEAVASRDTELHRVPKVKKTRVRDEINKATKKIRESKYGNMVDAMSQGAKDKWSSQRGLEKEAATSGDIAPLGFKITATNSDQVSKCSKRKKDDKAM